MRTKRFCDFCFAEKVENLCPYECPPVEEQLTKKEKKVLNKFFDTVLKKEDWIEVKSPFKAYPPSEGV